MDPQAVVLLLRALVQLGVSVEQYREAVDNPDMTDAELAQRIMFNTDKIKELREKDH